jgi:hypothetical protein
MKWAAVLGITVVMLTMFLYDWPKIGRQLKKERVAFVALTVLGGILAVMLIFNPEMPGPTQWIDTVYKPLVKLLGQS